jgi:hypothetical protein
MWQTFAENPWLIVCALAAAVIVICVAIVFISEHLRTSHQAEIDAMLKHDMIERGMSAADIKTVLEATTDGEAARLALNGTQGVRLGLGSFHVEVGSVNKGTAATDKPAASHS